MKRSRATVAAGYPSTTSSAVARCAITYSSWFCRSCFPFHPSYFVILLRGIAPVPLIFCFSSVHAIILNLASPTNPTPTQIPTTATEGGKETHHVWRTRTRTHGLRLADAESESAAC
ncbi:hypothetical protein FIBSPDRAFT_99968 [Athelia psychrophila]|uniref:Uncharacterized protein n=1 Tax=Athelia psychrophila TaxID=1759441 RepID=A0A166DNA2_9AGAM|nr:hypothetical protein FIBSPDRAFT_99968 [Fibularhizoctonia sp. CBS 109695]